MKSAQYVVTNAPAIFFLFAIAILVWSIRREMRADERARLTRRSTPKFTHKPYTHKEHNYEP